MRGDPQNLTELKRDIKRISEASVKKRAAKFSVKQGGEQSCATQEKAGFSGTFWSGGVVERGDAGLIAKKSPKNVL